MDQTIRILHLEDDPVEQELVERQLRLAGLRYEWQRVATEVAFESAIAAGGHNLILCDCKIPGYDGRTAVIRAHACRPEVPIIVLTGALRNDEGVDYLKAGAWDFVLKQYPERLPYVVARALEQASSTQRRKQVESALRAIADTSASQRPGVDILHHYLEDLHGILGAQYAFVGLLEGEHRRRVRIRAGWPRARVPEEFEYPLPDSPCATVVTAGSDFLVESISVRNLEALSPFSQFDSKSWLAMPLLNTARVPIGFLACVLDSSVLDADKRQNVLRVFAGPIASELRRERSERRYQQLFEFAPDAIVMTDQDGRMMTVNRQAETLFGWTRIELVGQQVEMLMPASSNAAHISLRELLAGSPDPRVMGAGRRNLRGLRKDGQEFPIEVSLGPMESENGMMFAAAIRDVTDREQVMSDLERAAEELRTANLKIEKQHDRLVDAVAERTAELTTANGQLEKAKTDAEQANRAKSAFLAAMSHEIRTPMNGVIGTADVLARSDLSDDQAELLGIIQRSAGILLSIIDEILDFSKIEAGKLEIEHSPILVRDTVEGLCSSLIPVAERGGVDLTLFVSPEVPERLLADEVRLHQVLYNLVGNAIKFSGNRPGRRGRVSVRISVAQAAPLRISFAIADDGIGMTQDTLGKLFVAFTQGETSTTRRFGGTGLGLAICKRLVELMRGWIEVDSTAGSGSRFTVTLPFEAAPEQPERVLPDLSGLCCFVVESTEFNAEDVCLYLRDAGAQVSRVADCRKAGKAAAGVTAPVVIVGGSEHQQVLGTMRNAVALNSGVLRRGALLRAVALKAGRGGVASMGDTTVLTEPIAHGSPMVTVAEARAAGRLILVAEDDPINQSVISQQLKLLGYAAQFAANGIEALDRWRTDSCGLLLTDLDMPEMDGYALTAAVRGEEAGKRRIPIVALTANALRGQAKRARAAGMDDYLTKPIRLEALSRALEKWLPRPIATPEALSVSQPSSVNGASPVVDISVLKALVGGDPTIVRGLLVDYVASARRLTIELRAAADAKDLTKVSRIAHRLKSSSRTVGALLLGDLCETLESVSKAGESMAIAQHTSAFESLLVDVDGYIRKLTAEGECDDQGQVTRSFALENETYDTTEAASFAAVKGAST